MDPPRLSSFVLAKNKVAAVKAAEDAKKRKAEEDANRVLQSFVNSFDSAAGAQRSSTWIRGGVEGGKPVAGASAQEQVYEMKIKPAMAIFDDDESAESSIVKADAMEASGTGPTARRRQMDAFLAELKDRQDRADGLAPTSAAAWETDTTSNISIRNLAPSVTEEVLSRLCGRYGPVSSIKIMWPRTEEERARGKNTGFVLYERRKDAEAAMDALQDYFLEGMRLLLGWAKGVRATTAASTVYIPSSQAVSAAPITALETSKPLPNATALSSTAFTSSPGAVDPLPGRSRQSRLVCGVPRRVRSGWDAMEQVVFSDVQLPQASVLPADATTVTVHPPLDPAVRRCADMWSTYLLSDGQAMEAALLAWYRQHEEDREAAGRSQMPHADVHPLYTMRVPWLDDPHGDAAVYLRWRVWSLAQGDTLRAWRTAPFQCTAGGSWWIPPPCPSAEDLLEAEAEDLVHLLAEEHEGARAGLKRKRAGSLAEREEKGKLTLDQQVEWAALLSFRSPPGGGPHGDTERGVADDGVEEDDAGEEDEDEGQAEMARDNRGADVAKATTHHFLPQRRKGLTLSNRTVHAAMLFALDHAECASQVTSILSMALREDGAPVPLLVARLYVAADVLSASATAQVKNASSYRSALQSILPPAFEYLGGRLRHGGAGRISKEAFRERVLRVLAAWEKSFVFPSLFVTGLEATFLRPHDIPSQQQGNAMPGGAVGQGQAGHGERAELERRCRLSGVSCDGDTTDLQARLEWINEHVKLRMGLAGEGTASLHEDLAALTKQNDSASVPLSTSAAAEGGGTKKRTKRSETAPDQVSGSWQEVSESAPDTADALPALAMVPTIAHSMPSMMAAPHPQMVQQYWANMPHMVSDMMPPAMNLLPTGYSVATPMQQHAVLHAAAPGMLGHAPLQNPVQAASQSIPTATTAQQLLAAALSAAASFRG